MENDRVSCLMCEGRLQRGWTFGLDEVKRILRIYVTEGFEGDGIKTVLLAIYIRFRANKVLFL